MELIITSRSDLKDLIGDSVLEAMDSLNCRDDLEEDSSKPWLTNREAQKFFGLSKSTLQRYRNSGKLSYSKIGGRVYYRRADMVKLLEENLRSH